MRELIEKLSKDNIIPSEDLIEFYYEQYQKIQNEKVDNQS
mgnify:CR=1 FL=1